jgi:hypothetical protein
LDQSEALPLFIAPENAVSCGAKMVNPLPAWDRSVALAAVLDEAAAARVLRVVKVEVRERAEE